MADDDAANKNSKTSYSIVASNPHTEPKTNTNVQQQEGDGMKPN